MFKISIASFIVLAAQFLLSEVAFAGQLSIKRGIQLRSWTDDTPVNVWIKDEITLVAFTNSISKILKDDEELSNLQDLQVIAIQEGNSSDEVLMRFTAKDKRWPSAGILTFDADVRAYQDGRVGALTVTSWSSTVGGYNANGPRYDLPRAILLPRE